MAARWPAGPEPITMRSNFCMQVSPLPNGCGSENTAARQDIGAATCRSTVRERWLALLPAIEALFDFLPIHYIPPRGHIVRAAVLILQVICVFPYVQSHHRVFALH